MRRFILIFIAFFVALFTSMSFFDQPETVYGENSTVATGKVTASSLNVRSEPNQNARRLGVLAEGSTVEIVQQNVNKDWHQIRFNQQLGFVHRDFVRINQTANNTIVGKGTVTVNTLNVRAEPNQSARRITVLNSGARIDIYEVGVNKDWLKIRVNNEWAYVHGSFVTVMPTNPSSPAPASNTIVGKGTVTVNTLNVRAEPNQNARRITVLNSGAKIDIYEVGVNKDWLKIRVNNEWAYVHGSFVTVMPTNPSSPAPASNTIVGKGTVTVNTLNVRAEPNQNARRITVLNSGARIDIYEVGVNKDWLKIRVNNEWAYVHGGFVTIVGTNTNVDTKKLANKVIVIDPGHGGRDPGAVAFGLREKDIVLDVSLILQKKLEQAGAKVHMTRSNDVFLSLNDRAQVVKRHNADIFLSLHVNSATLATAHGTETFWNRNFQSSNSQRLATNLQRSLVNQLGTRDRGVKEASFEIIKYTQVPSVLIELGFLTNQAEANRLASPQFQDQAAQAIVNGLVEYYNNN